MRLLVKMKISNKRLKEEIRAGIGYSYTDTDIRVSKEALRVVNQFLQKELNALCREMRTLAIQDKIRRNLRCGQISRNIAIQSIWAISDMNLLPPATNSLISDTGYTKSEKSLEKHQVPIHSLSKNKRKSRSGRSDISQKGEENG